MTALNLANNNMRADYGALALASVLQQGWACRTMTDINLANNNIGPTAMEALAWLSRLFAITASTVLRQWQLC